MNDKFARYPKTTRDPAEDAFAITPSDDTDFDNATRAIYVGTGGDAVIVTVKGTPVTFKNLPSGTVISIRAQRINATDTTASDLIGLL